MHEISRLDLCETTFAEEKMQSFSLARLSTINSLQSWSMWKQLQSSVDLACCDVLTRNYPLKYRMVPWMLSKESRSRMSPAFPVVPHTFGQIELQLLLHSFPILLGSFEHS